MTPLLHDLFAFVAAVQREPAALRRDGLLTKAALLRLNESLLVREDLTGVRSAEEAGRLAFLDFVAREENLVQARERRLTPMARAWRWFSLPARQQATELWCCWRDARAWDDLRQVRSLRCRPPASAPHDPAAARQRALAVLAQVCPPGTWLPLSDVVGAVREQDPAFLRPPGAPRWEIADAVTGRDLAPARYWDRVEGALLRYLLTGPLHWLGCVSLGYDAAPPGGDTGGTLAFCALTPLGAHLWGISAPPWMPPAREPLVIQPNFEIVVPFHADLGAALRVERLAELVQAGPARVYRLTRDRFRAALDAGADAESLLAFLEEASGVPLPQNVAYTLREWAGQYGRVCLAPAVLLRVPAGDEPLMQELRAARRIAPLLGEALSPTVSVVAAENVPALAGRLREDGYLPRVELEVVEEPPTGRLHLAEREVVPLLAAAYVVLQRAGERGAPEMKDLAALVARLERRLSQMAQAQAERQARQWLRDRTR